MDRDAFRITVFARDGGKCVLCPRPAVDAHHILERRLWADGGYFPDNGASVCAEHHLACERTLISVEEVRIAAGISRIVVPEHLYPDQSYDKWGNPILANGQRLKGDLFFDEGVQKVLAEGRVLHLFTDRVKYPRTYHLPWSPGVRDDDRVIGSLAVFTGRDVVVTEKLDGENTTCYPDGTLHARSVDGRGHASRNWVKKFWSERAHDLPEGWRLCGENVYALHSIRYDDLPSYFFGFSVWDEQNRCLPWDETLEWFALLGVTPVPVLYRGVFEEATIRALYDPRTDHERREGYVLRLTEGFAYGQFRHSVAKYVRRDHVMTEQHWMHGRPIVPNGLRA